MGTLPRAAALVAALLALAGCNSGDVGYVEVRAVPATADMPLFLDTVKLDPIKGGVTVMQQRVGTTKLQAGIGGGNVAPLCDVVVRKNRITTVTVSVLERPLRCVCRTGATAGTANPQCVS